MEMAGIKHRLQQVVSLLSKESNIDYVSNALDELENIRDSIVPILQGHWDIQSSDDQYSDPEMWDLEPVYDVVAPCIEKLAWICNWFDDDYGIDDTDEENIQIVISKISNALSNL